MPDPAESLILSACLGALVGLIRQWEIQQTVEKDVPFSGVRTFAILALLGCLAAFVADRQNAAVFPVVLGVVGVLLVSGQFTRSEEQPAGYTTPGAALATFFVGALVFWRERQAAVLITAMTMLLLGLRQPIHQWTRRFTVADLRSALQFVAITGVILPLVPNRSYGPFDAFNPWSIWLMVVLISGLGFLGYLLMRQLGPKAGILLTGLVGGLASSTATTLTFSRRSREDPAESPAYAVAVVLACNVMLVRVAVITAAISPPLMRHLAIPMTSMLLPGLLYTGWVWFRRPRKDTTVEAPAMRNPLNLSMAVKFAVLYGLVQLLVKAATSLQWSRGVLAISAIAGLTDVDAISVSMANAARETTLALTFAALAVMIGCISNTLAKALIALLAGERTMGRLTAGVLLATAVAGGLGAVWIG